MSRTDINPTRYISQEGKLHWVSEVRNGSSNPPHSEGDMIHQPWYELYENRRSQVTPHFGTAAATGNLLPLNFHYSKVEDTRYVGHSETLWLNIFYDKSVGVFSGIVGNAWQSQGFPSAAIFNLQNKVKQKVSMKIKDQDVNLAQAWGEREQTLRLLKDSFNRMAKSLNALRHGNFSQAAAALGVGGSSPGFNRSFARGQSKAIARGWLELQYGWQPLLSDIYGASKALQKSFIKREYVLVHARSKLVDVHSEAVKPDAWTMDVYSYDKFCEVSISLKMMRESSVLSAANALGLTNPAAVAWELTPFSFVFDWAVPIGNFLNQFDASFGWSFHSASMTTFERYLAKMQRSSIGLPPNYQLYNLSGSKSHNEVECNRQGLSSFLDLISLPVVKDPNSVIHAANAVSLFLTHKR